MPAPLNLAGRVVGRLTVYQRVENRNGSAYWLGLCKCGAWKIVKASYLNTGRSRSCGCAFSHARQLRNVQQFRDLTHKRFGRLKVIEMAFKKDRTIFWRCKCDCGSEMLINGKSLKGGITRSCGCYQREQARKHQKRAWRRSDYRKRKSEAQKQSCVGQSRARNGAFAKAA